MTIKEFFESGNSLAIHCDTEEKANKLLGAFDEAGYCWRNGGGYKVYTLWDIYRKNACYSNHRRCGDIDWYKNEGYQLLEFEEVELEDISKK